MIHLRVLGPIELTDGAREIKTVLVQPKRLALLAYLAVAPRGFHRRDTLLAMFWPELDDAHARSSLNQALRFLRKELGGGREAVIVSRGAEEVGLNEAGIWCDAREFVGMIERGDHARAMSLYRGELLEGFFVDDAQGFEEWLEQSRALFRSRADAARARPVTPQPAMEVIASQPAEPGRPADASRLRRRRMHRIAGLGLLAAGIAAAWNVATANTDSRTDLAIVPFAVRAPDTSHDFLRDAIVDLLYARLAEEPVPGITHSTTVMRLPPAAGAPREPAQDARATRLPRGVRAQRVVTGEVVVTTGGAVVTARLIDVPTDRVLIKVSAAGHHADMPLVTRLADAFTARMFGDSQERIDALSANADAVKDYLNGLRLHRRYRPRLAFDAFTRALERDTTFAAAALWRAYIGWGGGAFATAERRTVDSAAWALRARVSRGDSLMLVGLASIGPNYPRPSTAIEILQAQEVAARRNRDRPEAWTEWARHLLFVGQQAGVPKALELATFAVDSAVTLDPGFAPALVLRLALSWYRRDSAAVREYRRRLDSMGVNIEPSFRWAAASVLGDSAEMRVQLVAMADRPSRVSIPRNLELWAAHYGIASTADAAALVALRLSKPDVTEDERRGLRAAEARIAALRGQRVVALKLLDSINDLAIPFMLAAAESGYDAPAERAARERARQSVSARDTTQRANATCDVEIWRMMRGDTATARRAVASMRSMIATMDAAPAWRVGRLGLCPLLGEAMLEHSAGARDSIKRHQLRDLLLQGAMAESPGNIANLIAARIFEARGDRRTALELIRRRDPMAAPLVQPESWRLEGNLALSVGDTVGAVRAYSRYLAIRDLPDPGPLTEERQRVQSLMTRLKR